MLLAIGSLLVLGLSEHLTLSQAFRKTVKPLDKTAE
jgi:hypothetical protein